MTAKLEGGGVHKLVPPIQFAILLFEKGDVTPSCNGEWVNGAAAPVPLKPWQASRYAQNLLSKLVGSMASLLA